MKSNINAKIKRVAYIMTILYLFGIVIWNSMYTFISDRKHQKIQIENIEQGKYSPTFFDYFSPYDRRISIDNDLIGHIYAESDMKNFNTIKTGDSVWMEIRCVEASSWKGFFLFSFKFNYELMDLPDSTKETLENDSLKWTTNLLIGLPILLFVFGAFFYENIKKRRQQAK
jgi:hypothetical protein